MANSKPTPADKADSANLKQDEEARIDEAVEETFPASDPISPDAGKNSSAAKKPSAEDEEEKELDDALEDTFPASDPVPISDPSHAKKK